MTTEWPEWMTMMRQPLLMTVSESPRAGAGATCECGALVHVKRERVAEWEPCWVRGRAVFECCLATSDRLIAEMTAADLAAKGRC